MALVRKRSAISLMLAVSRTGGTGARIKSATVRELEDVRRKMSASHMSWEQERQILEERCTSAEMSLEGEKRKVASIDKVIKDRESGFLKQIEALQSEVRSIWRAIDLLSFKFQKTRESDAHEREKLLLRLENVLLRFERRLPPPSKQG